MLWVCFSGVLRLKKRLTSNIWQIEYGYIKLDNMTNNEIIFLLLGLLLGLQIALLIQTIKNQ